MINQKYGTILRRGLENGAYPCFAAAVGKGDEVFYYDFEGYRAIIPEKKTVTEDTLFDMASLTKLMGTTMASLKMMEEGKISLSDRVSKYFGHCGEKGDITVFDLMTHTSSLPAHLPLFRYEGDPCGNILSAPSAYEKGTKTVYSCMGYILLGKILEKICRKPLDEIVKEYVFSPLGMNNSYYNPPKNLPAAATEYHYKTGNMICGSVHDENADHLGGVAGNAGMFCTLGDTVKFAAMLSKRGKGYMSSELFEKAVTDYTPELSESRGLGFQLYGGKPFPGGSNMSAGSYGHTGFTGTALYVDNETGVYAVLLTNRVHPTRENGLIYPIRREFFDTVFSEE